MKRLFTFIAVLFFTANLFAQVTVTYNVNMNDSITSGWFVVGTDILYMSGTGVGGWDEPGSNSANEMTDSDGDGIYTLVYSGLTAGDYEYKYFKNAGWNTGGEWDGGDNRTLTVGTANVTVNDVFGDIDAHVVGVRNISKISINIHPNPSTGIFQLSSEVNYEVVDLTGKIVKTGYSNSINLTGFTSGMYIVKLETNEGISLQKLIIK